MALFSAGRFKVVDLLCEGPIAGYATEDPYESIFLNDIPLRINANGVVTESFEGKVNFDTFPGSNAQGLDINVSGRHGLVNTFVTNTVDQEMGHNYEETVNPADSRQLANKDSRDYGPGSVFYQVTNPETEIIEPIVRVNALYSTSVEGQTRGMLFAAAVDLKISIFDGDGKKVFENFKIIKGIVTNGYQRSLGSFNISTYKKPVTLRVHKRAQVRSNNNYKVPIYEHTQEELPEWSNHWFFNRNAQNQITGKTFQKDDYQAKEAAFVVNVNSIVDQDFKELYPFGNGRANSVSLSAVKEKTRTSVPWNYSAVASVHISTEAFPQLPTRSYLIKGLLMRIPSNALPRRDGSLSFGGNFDGALSAEFKWTTCPVCAWFEMATNERFGADLPFQNFNWIDLYPLCRYANERLLINGVSATYSAAFTHVDNSRRFNIGLASGGQHGFVAGETIFVIFTAGPLSETSKTVYEFDVLEINAAGTVLAIQGNRYMAEQGVDTSSHNGQGTCLISKKAEARFAVNMVIGSQAQAYEVLQDMASIFRGMTYWHQNSIQVTADHGELYKINEEQSVIEPVHLFTNANVTEEGFSYEGTGLSTRSTSVKVSYNDPDNKYEPDYVCVEDVIQRDRYGHREREVVGIGCTSRTQAIRMGRWILASERLNDTVVRFSTGLEGALVLPGQVFAIADEVRSGVASIAGRVSAKHAANQIKIDRDLSTFLNGLTTAKIKCVTADGLVEEKDIDINASKTNTHTDATTGKIRTIISLVSGQSFNQAPVAGAAYSIAYTSSEGSVSEEKYRCLGIEDNGDGTFAINGVKHDDSIYKTTDSNTFKVEKTITTGYSQVPDPPQNLNINFRRVIVRGTLFYRAALSYERGPRGVVTETKLFISIDGKEIINHGTTKLSDTYELDRDLEAGQIVEFRCTQMGLNGKIVEATFSRETPTPNIDEDFRTTLQNIFVMPSVGVEKVNGVEEYSSIFDHPGIENRESDLQLIVVESQIEGQIWFPGVYAPMPIKAPNEDLAIRVTYTSPEKNQLVGLLMQVRHTAKIIDGEAAEDDWNQARILLNREPDFREAIFNMPWIPGTYMFRYRSMDGFEIKYSPVIVTRVCPDAEAHASTSDSSLTLPNSNPPPLFRTHRITDGNFGVPDTANTPNAFEVVEIGPSQSPIRTLRLKENARRGIYYLPVSGGIDGKILDLGDVFEVEIEFYVENADLTNQEDSSYSVELLVYKSDDPFYPEEERFTFEDGGRMLTEDDLLMSNGGYFLPNVDPIFITGRKVITGRRFRFAVMVSKRDPFVATGTPIIKELEVRIYARYRSQFVEGQISNDYLNIYDNYKTHGSSFSPLAPVPGFMKWDNIAGQFSEDNGIYEGEVLSSDLTGGPVTSIAINSDISQGVPGVVHGIKAMTEGNRYSINSLDSSMTTGDWQEIGWTGVFPAVGDIFICKRRPKSGNGKVQVLANADSTTPTVPKGKHYTIGIFNNSTPVRCPYRAEVVGYGKAIHPNG